MEYVKRHQVSHAILNSIWLDTGSIQTLFEANQYIRGLSGGTASPHDPPLRKRV
jgi:dTDP-glucose pyrophosphorylase